MSFCIDVGTDLYGTKINTTLLFPTRPTVAELTAASESYFDTKSRSSRPAGYPDTPFKIETFQLFDETLLRWVDLYNEQQLRPGVQIWCFQPESIWHSDAQGVIPAAEKPAFTWTTPLGSPRRARIAADAGVPPTLSEKLRSVFFQIDENNKGYLLFQDLENAFRRCDMVFNNAIAGDLFNMADTNRSQHITYDEWVNFAVRCPSVVDALFFRMRDMFHDQSPNSPPPYDMQKARHQELQQFYTDSWSAQKRHEQQSSFDEARLKEAERRREEAERAVAEHAQALEQAQAAAAQHAQQHAAARQAASEQSAAIDAAQQTMLSAEHAAAEAAAQQAAARQAEDRARHARDMAERALAEAQAQRQAAQAQADSEAAAQYAAEQHAAQQQLAKQQAMQVAAAAQQEALQAAAAASAAQQAARAAAETARAQEAAMQAQQLAAQQQEAARAAAQAAAAREAQQAREMQAAREAQAARDAAMAYAASQHHMSQQQQHQYSYAHSPQPPSPGADHARREYEEAKRRADELRARKEEAEREEREAWNKLYYSPASPHYLPSPSH